MATLTKKELLEAIDKKMRELYPFTIDPFLQGVNYQVGMYDGLEFVKNLIKDLC